MVENTKGGVGKSTLAGNLAWAFAEGDGLQRRVLLVDADPQATVTKWFDLADSVPFARIQLNTARVLGQQIARFRSHYPLTLVDCPPMQADITAAATAQADLALIPILPSPIDILAYVDLLPLLRQAQGLNRKLQLFFVMNQVDTRTVLTRAVQESLADAEIPLMPTMIHFRQIYRRIVEDGVSVIKRSGSAQEEMLALAKDIERAFKK